MNKKENKAIFLDRDGTVIVDKSYLYKESEIEFIEGVPETLKKLKDRGFFLIVVTNQSGVARGYFTEDDVIKVNNRINEMLREEYDFELDAFYYCPHHPQATVESYKKICSCRKPAPGMVLKAKEKFNISIEKSYMIGDKDSDKIKISDLQFIKVDTNKKWRPSILLKLIEEI